MRNLFPKTLIVRLEKDMIDEIKLTTAVVYGRIFFEEWDIWYNYCGKDFNGSERMDEGGGGTREENEMRMGC